MRSGTLRRAEISNFKLTVFRYTYTFIDKYRKMKNIFAILTVSLLLKINAFSQVVDASDSLETVPDTLLVEKRLCEMDSLHFFLYISESKHPTLAVNDCDFTYDNLFIARYIHKLYLIEQLLAFMEDTSKVCCEVYCYRKNNLASRKKLKTREYSVQIAALYHINMIIFGAYSTYYAPFPVLVRRVDNCEINNLEQEVNEVFKIYKDWYYKCKATNFNYFTFPLLGTDYKWAFGEDKRIEFDKLPIIRSEFKHSIGKKVLVQ